MRRSRSRSSFGLILAACCSFVAPGASRADVVNIASNSLNSESHLGLFTGSLSYTADTATTATLIVSLTNTSPVANGGYLTAFALNMPGGVTGATLSPDPTGNFGLLGGANTNSVNGAPYGGFDFGAGSGGDFEGGGPPQQGLAVGQSGAFTFNLTGANLNLLTASSFLTAFSTGSTKGDTFFVARFRGFEEDGSDKVPATGAVPEPASMVMLGLGVGSMVALGVRRRPSRTR